MELDTKDFGGGTRMRRLWRRIDNKENMEDALKKRTKLRKTYLLFYFPLTKKWANLSKKKTTFWPTTITPENAKSYQYF
jgi:hypothetical protein